MVPASGFSIDKTKPFGVKTVCKKCRCEEEKERRVNNPIAYKTQRKKSYVKNRKSIIAKAAEWAKNNPENRKAIANRYAKKNIHKIKAWSKKHPERLREGRRRRQAIRREKMIAAGVRIAPEQWNELIIKSNSTCSYCGNPCKTTVDHFIPIAMGGRTEKGNLVVCCRTCNSRKGASNPHQWVKDNYGEEKLNEIIKRLTA